MALCLALRLAMRRADDAEGVVATAATDHRPVVEEMTGVAPSLVTKALYRQKM